jgi:adenylate kinase family enzyme
LPNRIIPVHLLLGQPGSGKDSRLGLLAEETGADIFRFGTIFDRYASALPAPSDIIERAKFYSDFEVDNTLVNDDDLLRRISSSGYLTGLREEQQLWALKIAYYGGFKTGLIPDYVVNSIYDAEVAEHLRLNQPRSIILNSYPKTLNQYRHLRRQLSRWQTATLFVEGIAFLMEYTAWDVLEERIAKRLVCGNCGHVHAVGEIKRMLDNDNICTCGNKMKQRRDTQIFEKRKLAYKEHTAPMIDKVREDWRSCVTLANRPHFDLALVHSGIKAALSAWPGKT